MSNRYGSPHPYEEKPEKPEKPETNSGISKHDVLISIETKLSEFIEALDPNSDLYAWLDHTNGRLVKARAMITKEESRLNE